MDRFVVRATNPSDLPPDNQLCTRSERPKCSTAGCKRKSSLLSAYEIDGRVLPSFKTSLTKLLLSSYSEFVAHHEDPRQLRSSAWCPFHPPHRDAISPFVTTIDFDSKGIYLASGNSAGRLFIHEFETLYCSAGKGADQNRSFFIRCYAKARPVQAVKWNPANEDEVACVCTGSNEVFFYDVACESNLSSEVLRVKSTHTLGDWGSSVGLFDLAFFKIGKASSNFGNNFNIRKDQNFRRAAISFSLLRALACGRDGQVHLWDRRSSKASYAALTVPKPNWTGGLNSVQLSSDEQMLYSGSEGGYIYLWDLRGGRSAAFVTSARDLNHPVAAISIEKQLLKIPSLRAQTDIGSSSVDALSLNPACGKQLAFHLSCGWSGVLDMTALDVTHIHCPPPPWSNRSHDQRDPVSVAWPHSSGFTIGATPVAPATDAPRNDTPPFVPQIRRRRPVWLNTWPVYAVGSGSERKVHMLDFTPGPKSRYSLDYNGSNREEEWQTELHTSEAVVVMASHPMNNTLVAGCEAGKLLLIGQKKSSISGQEASDNDMDSKVSTVEGSAFGAQAE